MSSAACNRPGCVLNADHAVVLTCAIDDSQEWEDSVLVCEEHRRAMSETARDCGHYRAASQSVESAPVGEALGEVYTLDAEGELAELKERFIVCGDCAGDMMIDAYGEDDEDDDDDDEELES